MYYVVPMPYNKYGSGPEMDPTKVVGTDYEVWCDLYLSHGSFPTESLAEKHAADLNRRAQTLPRTT